VAHLYAATLQFRAVLARDIDASLIGFLAAKLGA
jgi:hypothetical protein